MADDVQGTHAYLPVEIDGPEFGWSRDELYEELKTYNVYTRRYFYPLICDYTCYRRLALQDPLAVARRVASRILTLPIYPDLAEADVHRICDIIHHIRQEHRKPVDGVLVASQAPVPRPGAPVADAAEVLVTP